MTLIADGFLFIAAAAAAAYCIVLSRRLSRLNGLQGGLGGAILSLSERVDAMNAALAEAKSSTESAARELSQRTEIAMRTTDRLQELVERAERLETPERDEFDQDVVEEELSSEETSDPLETPPDAANAIDVIRKAPEAEEDDAFAMRLVDALSALQPKPETRP